MLRPARMVRGYALFHREHLDRVLSSLQDLGQVQFFDIKEHLPELLPIAGRKDELYRERERTDRLLDEIQQEVRQSLMDRLLGPSTLPVILERPSEDPLAVIRTELQVLESRWLPLKKEWDSTTAEVEALRSRMQEVEEKLYRDSTSGIDDRERLQEFGSLVAQEEKVQRQLEALEKTKRHFIRYARPVLLGIRERIDNLLERDRILTFLGSTTHAVVIGFWVPQKDAEKVRRLLNGATQGACVMETRRPAKSDAPPVLLENPWFIRPYEVLTTTYGIPRYNDLDPTPILAVTFTMLFGLMFADVGYGLTVFLLGLAILLKTNREDRLVRDLNIVFIFAGTASIVFGLLFGEFFGGLVMIAPLWRNPMESILMLLYLSLLLGAVHITVSLLSRIAGEVAYGNPPLYPLSLLIILWSLVWFIIIGGTLVPLLTVSLFYGLACLVKTKGGEALHELLALVGNVISYARVGILFILHVTVARILVTVLYALSPTPMGLVVGILVFLAGTSFIIVSSALFVFIHSLRLHWIEFFRRFYSGLGQGFEPFTQKRRYTIPGSRMA